MALEPISQVIWFIFFGISIILGTLILRKVITEDLTRPQTEYYLGSVAFILIHAICRIFYYIHDFTPGYPDLYWELGAIFGLICLIPLLYAIERNIYTRSKFLITILTIIFIILLFVLPVEYKPILQTIIISIAGAFIPLIYVYVAMKGTGSIRKSSLLIAGGIFIFLLGQTFHHRLYFPLDGFIYLILSPLLITTGLFIWGYGLVRRT